MAAAISNIVTLDTLPNLRMNLCKSTPLSSVQSCVSPNYFRLNETLKPTIAYVAIPVTCEFTPIHPHF